MTWRAWVFLGALGLGASAAGSAALAAPSGTVVVVPIHGTVDDGMAHLVDRAVRDADRGRARALVLDLDTFGGLIGSATRIRDRLLAAQVPVDAFVSGRAWSAGALIALAAERIAMVPGATIGAAEPIPTTVTTLSALRGEFAATAAVRHRDRTLAEAMVDPNVAAPQYQAPGAILTLTADEAQRTGILDAVVPTQAAALERWRLDPRRAVDVPYTLGERAVRFATEPAISSLLLSIGFVGLLLEMQTLHLIAGTIGAGALALFFGTHVYAGFSNELVLGLALLGIIGILLELHVLPGHGIAGGLGLVALVAAVVLAFGLPLVFVGVQSVAVAIVVSVALYVFATRIFPQNAFMRRVAFPGVQGPEYVAAPDYHDLIGHQGIATSYLRPAGVAAIDGRRLDVLTEGDFLPAGAPVVVTRVEGARIFVRAPVAATALDAGSSGTIGR